MFSYLSDKLNVKSLGEMLAPTLTLEQQLHQAIEDNLLDKVQFLLDQEKVSPSALSAEGFQPIHTAAYFGRIEILQLLLHVAPDSVSISTLGLRDNTPLHLACAQGHLEMAKFLVCQGANVAQRNKSGRTSYDVAKGDTIRQFLLPLQFQHEDPNDSAKMLPAGITPTMDPSQKPVLAPPPPTGMNFPTPSNPTGQINSNSGSHSAPPMHSAINSGYHNTLYAPATHSAIPKALANRTARDPSVYRPIQADGFGSSVGNEELTAKFGNTKEIRVTAPPPTSDCSNAASVPPNYSPPKSIDKTPPQGVAAAPNAPQFKIFNPKQPFNHNTASASSSSGGSHSGMNPGYNMGNGNGIPYNSNTISMHSNPTLNSPMGDNEEVEEVNFSANTSVMQ